MRVILIVIITGIIFFSCKEKSINSLKVTASDKMTLHDHSSEFHKQIVKVGNKTHVAIGYGLANSIMIEGNDGIIIIDAMESLQEGEEVIQAFKKIADKPVKAIIYTHNHTDHIFGAKAIAGDDNPKIYAHKLLPYYLDRVSSVIRPIIEKRSYRMFGNLLNQEELVNCGIGPHLSINENTLLGVLRPTVTFKDSIGINISGVRLKLYHAPGETPDQLFVWMPDEKMLFCGDNFYKSFPNLYTIRGTAYRDVNNWRNSLDAMRKLKPEKLIPSHTLPVEGKEEVYEALTVYRDAIQYVHDQTVRYINHGLTADEIVEKVQLPKHLATSPYLQEFYGKVEWSVRAIFNGYLGWFDGNPTTLHKLTLEEEAKRIASLAGGINQLKHAFDEALKNEDYQWALILSDYLLALSVDKNTVQGQKADILYNLGIMENNPNARHYYITYAKELKGLENKGLVIPEKDMVHAIPLDIIFNAMAVNLKAEKVMDVEKSITWYFPDVDEYYSIVVRKGIAEVVPAEIKDADYNVEVNSTVWKELLAELIKPLPTFIKGDIKVTGGKASFIKLIGYFERTSEIKDESIYLN